MKFIYLVRGIIAKAIKFVNLPLMLFIKFAAYFWLFHYVAGMDGFLPGLKINSIMIQIVLAVISTILPNRCGVLLAIVLGLANIWKITVLGTAVTGILFFLVYITTSRLFPDQVYMLILVPLALHYKLYLMLPIVAGMYVGVIAIIPMILGVIFSILLGLLPEFMKLQMPAKVDEVPQMLANVFKYVFGQVLHNDTLIFLMILFTVIVVLIYLLRKIDVNYANYIALLAGCVVGVVCISMARMTFTIPESSETVLKYAIGTFLILSFCEFFRTALNYEAIQRLAFEDDEYQYHVTVIPKVGIPDFEKPKKEEPEAEEEEADEPEQTIDTKPGQGRREQLDIPPAPVPQRPAERTPVSGQTRRLDAVQEQPKAPAAENIPAPQEQAAELWLDEPQPEPAEEIPFQPEPQNASPEEPQSAPTTEKPAPSQADDSISSFFEEE